MRVYGLPLINGDLMNSTIDNTQLNPLCTTTWDQSPNYNAMCPGGSVTGCVATAMAQVMKYWNHPAQGTGMHSYNHDVYGTLTANFGATTYQWSSMPNSISSNNGGVVKFLTAPYFLGGTWNIFIGYPNCENTIGNR